MFFACTRFKGTGLNNWNVSNVRNMDSMFDDCEQFDSDLSHWDVSGVYYMGNMFRGCKKFNSDLSSWDLKSIKNADGFNKGCAGLADTSKLPKQLR